MEIVEGYSFRYLVVAIFASFFFFIFSLFSSSFLPAWRIATWSDPPFPDPPCLLECIFYFQSTSWNRRSRLAGGISTWYMRRGKGGNGEASQPFGHTSSGHVEFNGSKARGYSSPIVRSGAWLLLLLVVCASPSGINIPTFVRTWS